VATTARAAVATGLWDQECNCERGLRERAASPDNGPNCVADGDLAGLASGTAKAGFLEAPKEELPLMSAYSQSPSKYVLLCEAVKNGLDLNCYLSPVQDFTFFPENLDKNPDLNVHIASVKLNHIPGLRHLYIKLSLCRSDGRVWRACTMIDIGAEGIFFNRKYCKKNRLECKCLQRPIPMFNIDGTLNNDGPIRETVGI
jgi:hypothetical protein